LGTQRLAKDWDDKLSTQRQLQEDYERCLHVQPRLLSRAEREAIAPFAPTIPALWHAPTTTVAERSVIALMRRLGVPPPRRRRRPP
jgi:hypothetical protein